MDQAHSSRTGTLPIFSIYFKVKVLTSSGTTSPRPHGKGAVDGIGGTVKRMVWNAVSTRKVEAVKDACSFASVANKLSTSVAVTFVGSKELEATADLLGLKKFFSVAPVIPGIAKFHSLEPLRNGLIRCRTFSYQSTWIEMGVQFSGSENEDLNQNDSDDQDSSSLSKGTNSTSSADEDETSEEKGDFFSNASRNRHHTYKEGSSESSKGDRKNHDEEGDSSEEGLT